MSELNRAIHNKVADIDKVNPAKWWKEIKKTIRSKRPTGMVPSVP